MSPSLRPCPIHGYNASKNSVFAAAGYSGVAPAHEQTKAATFEANAWAGQMSCPAASIAQTAAVNIIDFIIFIVIKKGYQGTEPLS